MLPRVLITCFVLFATAGDLPFGSLPLTNQNGQKFRLNDFKSDFVFITFFYSRCPQRKMCPLSIRLTNSLAEKWKRSGLPRCNFLAITLEPQHDTERILAGYAKQESVNTSLVWLARATASDTNQLTNEFNVLDAPAHNVRSVLLGPKLRFLKNFDDNSWTAEDVLKTIAARRQANS